MYLKGQSDQKSKVFSYIYLKMSPLPPRLGLILVQKSAKGESEVWDVAFPSPPPCFSTPLGPTLTPAAPGGSRVGLCRERMLQRTSLTQWVLCYPISTASGVWIPNAGFVLPGMVL